MSREAQRRGEQLLVSADAAAEVPRYVVTGGGEPTAQQIAALVVALTPTAAPGDQPTAAKAALSGWALAALHEGVGGHPVVAAPDVTALAGT